MASGKITAIGARPIEGPQVEGLQEFTRILTPGLVNVHAHLEQSFGQVIPKESGETLADWLLQVVRRNRGGVETRADRIRQGVEELLTTGTTCVNDISLDGLSLKVLESTGLRGIVSLEFFHPGSDPVQLDTLIALYRQLIDAYKDHPLLQVGISPHAPYNVSPAAWKVMLEECHPTLVHAHVAETEDESAYLAGRESGIQTLHQRILGRTFQPERSAPSPVQYLRQFDLLHRGLIIAHAIHTSAEDRLLLQKNGVTVAHCPRSNLTLHGKTLDWTDWEGMNIPVGLGTDGHLSTEDLDLRAEGRFAMSVHGWSAEKTLSVLTLGGAHALGLGERIGSLGLGKSADFVLWKAPKYLSDLPPEEQVLHPDTSVEAVYVAGQSVMQPSRQVV